MTVFNHRITSSIVLFDVLKQLRKIKFAVVTISTKYIYVIIMFSILYFTMFYIVCSSISEIVTKDSNLTNLDLLGPLNKMYKDMEVMVFQFSFPVVSFWLVRLPEEKYDRLRSNFLVFISFCRFVLIGKSYWQRLITFYFKRIRV